MCGGGGVSGLVCYCGRVRVDLVSSVYTAQSKSEFTFKGIVPSTADMGREETQVFHVLSFLFNFKGTGSRDRFKIFWQKRKIVPGGNKNLYWISNLKDEHLMSCRHCHFPRSYRYSPMTIKGVLICISQYGFDFVYNSTKFFNSSNKFCSSQRRIGFVLFLWLCPFIINV
jgi:hypothetical protein